MVRLGLACAIQPKGSHQTENLKSCVPVARETESSMAVDRGYLLHHLHMDPIKRINAQGWTPTMQERANSHQYLQDMQRVGNQTRVHETCSVTA